MDREQERELDAVISEEKAKVVLGSDYFTLPYDQWVDELTTFVQTQRCADCGAGFDLESPEEAMWVWFIKEGTDEIEELEVVQFYCETCLDLPEAELEQNHPKTWGMMLFRREPTGTFPFDET